MKIRDAKKVGQFDSRTSHSRLFDVLDSEIASALKKLLTADIKRRVWIEEKKSTTRQSALERKTNC